MRECELVGLNTPVAGDWQVIRRYLEDEHGFLPVTSNVGLAGLAIPRPR